MNYLIIENGTIANIIVADAVFAESIGAKPYYGGAAIGDPYDPPKLDPTPEELSLDLLSDHEYRICMIELGLN